MKRKMRNVHPGEILKMELVLGRKFSVSKIAEMLSTKNSEISNILNSRAVISPTMALKLEAVFGGKADFFMRLQINYDLEKAQKKFKF
ncbi:addiction module antidote protein, HigA family [Flavobacterium aquidurense]|uniref:HigA family addiction module antitoxin n=1 Tax=Flavobacterium aquidurense TaxID=362413 RepID=UPI000912E264|nr:HigA family addiction module antitoxin [Flavobacterium aquidurense]OXA74016.1 addiction module antidote protein, HigA family [Flavobacterium aquidurense]SHG57969.1 addiction module antidote protein, HigA family [Flavobacterium frigidimaris]